MAHPTLDAAAAALGQGPGGVAQGGAVDGLVSVWAALIPAMELLVSDVAADGLAFIDKAARGRAGGLWDVLQGQTMAVAHQVGAFERERMAERDALAEQGQDVRVLDDLLAAMPNMLLTAYYEARLDRIVNPHQLFGPNGDVNLSHLPYQAPPPLLATASDTAWAWHAFTVYGIARWLEAYKAAPAIMRYARDLGEYDYAKSCTLGPSPLDEHTGFARAYLDGIFTLYRMDQRWDEVVLADVGQTTRQATLEAAGRGDSVRDLDQRVEAIIEELEAFNTDEERIMEILMQTRDSRERQYLLSQLLHSELEDGRAYPELERQLGDGEAFQRYRKSAGRFAQDSVGGRTETAELQLAQMARMVPGAVAGTGIGMLASTPILGDILEKEYGEDAKRFVDSIHAGCGVDGDLRRLSTEISIGGGKASGAVLGMAIGTGFSNGVKAWQGAAAGQKALTVAGGVYAGADLANNAYQAWTMEKVNGDPISTAEWVAAVCGTIGGTAAFVDVLRESDTAMGLLQALSQNNLRFMAGVETEAQAAARLQVQLDLPPKAGLEAIKHKLEVVVTSISPADAVGQGAKVYDAYSKDGAGEVAAMSDAEVRTKAEALYESLTGGGKPRTAAQTQLEKALAADDLAHLRAALARDLDRQASGSRVENTLGAAAMVLAPLAR